MASTTSPWILRLAIALIAGVVAVPTAAQPGAIEEATEPFFEAVDVEIVNVDVWVTDRNGELVEGLERDDFVVYRDREPVDIANFYAVAGGRPVRDPGAGAITTSASSAPLALLEASELETLPQHRLWLVAYIDNHNLHPIERNRVLPELERFLSLGLQAGAQVMIVTDNRSLQVRQPFTNQLNEVSAALEEIRDDAGQASLRRREQAATLHEIDDAGSADRALLHARLYAEEQMNAVDFTIGSLDRLIDTLGGLPGRKALLHVSSGIPMLAGEEMFHAVAEKYGDTRAYGEIPRHDTTRRFESLDRRANAHRVSFYTLDAGGQRGFQFGAAEYAGFVDMKLRSVLDSVVPENLQAPLRLMAQETGGRSILNTNLVLPALENVGQDFRSFYSLGISSVDADSGRYHELEVKLREPEKGTTVRHRAGYRSKSMRTRVRESLKSALLYSHQENPLGIEVVWGQPEREGDRGNYVLPIRLSVPLRDIALLPIGTDRNEARLELFVSVVGLDGRASDIDSAPFGARLADEHLEAAKKESLVHTHKLLLERGRQKVGVAVLDVFGSQSSIVTGLVQIGPSEQDPGTDAGAP